MSTYFNEKVAGDNPITLRHIYKHVESRKHHVLTQIIFGQDTTSKHICMIVRHVRNDECPLLDIHRQSPVKSPDIKIIKGRLIR